METKPVSLSEIVTALNEGTATPDQQRHAAVFMSHLAPVANLARDFAETYAKLLQQAEAGFVAKPKSGLITL
jgi:hypothetical protein